MTLLLDSLQTIITDINNSLSFDIFVIGGDFNAHTGTLGILDPDIADGTVLHRSRSLFDNKLDSRGEMLIDFMESNSFILLNGRSPGDKLGNYTFGSTLGNSTST